MIGEALSVLPGSEYHLEWVNTFSLALSRLAMCVEPRADVPTKISAILTDLTLPDRTGVAIVDQLFATAPRIPIMIIASEADHELANVAMRRGARDYFATNRVDHYYFPKAVSSLISHGLAFEILFDEKERAQFMLDSIGDAVIGTSRHGVVTYLNVVAERLTGWHRAEAIGRHLLEVFRLIDVDSRLPIPDPMSRAVQDNRLVTLPPSCILIARDGTEVAIEDSCAPIHNRLNHVTGAIMVFHDVTAARAVTTRLAHLAQHDSLTDLPNRVYLNDRLTQAIMMAKRNQTPLALLYIDLDRFKHINDSLGHLVGDRLLQSVATRLSQSVRASDTVSRQGGDEFVILLPDLVQPEDAITCAQKIIHAITLPYQLDDNELFVTASVGIVLYPEDGVDVETLLENADSAMYEAKDRGRNNYQFYRSDVNSKAIERQALETGLRVAIKLHEFELHYQPVVNLGTGTISGVEALIRWRHPTLGLLLPAHFMSVAEESGLIIPMGQWVLREGCRQSKMWQSSFAPSFRLAVNISAVELRSTEFLSDVTAILRETGFNPSCLDLELTETFLMQDSRSTALVLNTLKELGVHIALDDFGTGYSSLSYMRRFPIDVLKIDRSFVSNISTDVDDASVVRAIINMGKSLNMRVVAEGVETVQQLMFLEEHDCDEAQGYYFGRPLKAADFSAFLLEGTSPGGSAALFKDSYLNHEPCSDSGVPAKSTVCDDGQDVGIAPGGLHELERLEELYRYRILDTPAEERFDRLTRFASQACDVPIALISFIDRDRDWFKSHHGLATSQIPREQAFFAHMPLGGEALIIEDAAIDLRFANNPLLLAEPGIRFYAAIPLVTARGFTIGSLCVIDRRPRRLTNGKLATLKILADKVIQEMELPVRGEMLLAHPTLLDKVEQTARIGGWEIDLRTNELTWSQEVYRIHGLRPEQYTPTVESSLGFYTPDAVPVMRQALRAVITAAVQFDVELKIVRSDGEERWVRVIGSRQDEAGEARRVVGVFHDIDEVRQLENEIVDIAQHEQTRIGLDLHDGLGQELAGISFMLGGVLSSIPAADQGLRLQIAQIEALLRGATGTCGSVARGLSPTGRDRRGLVGAVRKLAARLEKVHDIRIGVRSQGRAWMLDDTIADHLYRIVQEAISNAIKHGPAQHIAVWVDWNADRTQITVTNDGGNIRKTGRKEGMGLHIMRYRARLVGATLAMSRTLEGGMRIRCHLPSPGPDVQGAKGKTGTCSISSIDVARTN